MTHQVHSLRLENTDGQMITQVLNKAMLRININSNYVSHNNCVTDLLNRYGHDRDYF